MTVNELIEKVNGEIKECRKFEKQCAKKESYYDAIRLVGMADAFKKILWDLKKINKQP